VVYLNSSESIQEFTFLEEEKNLLRAIGRLIGDYYDWRIIQDELHKSEANLSTIFNNIDIGYILLDLNDTILSFNKSMQNGYAQQNAANLQVGKKFLELISPERKLIKQAAFKEAITQKKQLLTKLAIPIKTIQNFITSASIL
jgi:PAS domain-containing protein